VSGAGTGLQYFSDIDYEIEDEVGEVMFSF
jgi:hypothetical protein